MAPLGGGPPGHLKSPPPGGTPTEVDCAYVSYWAGLGGLGLVENLFTHPDYRHRGIATGLITTAVDLARADGANAMLIGADPTDTPKAMYHALGFHPLCLQRSYRSERRR